MFYINYFKNSRWLITLIVITSLQFSCKKNDNLGAPVITGISAISPAPDDSALTQVTPGQLVVIQGKNFKDAKQIFFDGYPASINSALNTNNTMVITVPAEITFTSLQPDVANTIRLITSRGETIFKFPVIPPPPIINSISNEFAQAGEKITLTGSYLYTINKIIFPGNIEVTNGFTSVESGKSLQVTVPDNVMSGSSDSIAVVTSGGIGKAAFNNTFGIVANFDWGDPKFGWQYWGGINSDDASAFPGGWGNYIEIKPANTINAGDGSWYADNRAVMVAASSWEGVNLADPTTNYALKFEMSVKDPWTMGSLMIAINGNFNYLARYAPWEKTSSGQFKTDGWITVSIPLSGFLSGEGNYNSSGTPASNVGGLTGGNDGATIQIMLYNDGATPIASFDAAFDNVRVVKTK